MNIISGLLLLPLLVSAAPQENGPTPPIEPFSGSVVCPAPMPETTTDPTYFVKALDRLLTSPATAPFIGDSNLATRRRCYQNKDVNGCTTVAEYRDVAIQVCGDPYLNMLCGDVAWACEEILSECQRGSGGALVVLHNDVTDNAFVVRMIATEAIDILKVPTTLDGDDGKGGAVNGTDSRRLL
jgi:hypothetical protein